VRTRCTVASFLPGDLLGPKGRRLRSRVHLECKDRSTNRGRLRRLPLDGDNAMQTPPRLGTALSIVAAFGLAVLLPSAPVAGGNPADAPKVWTGIIVAPTSKLAPWAYEKFEL